MLELMRKILYTGIGFAALTEEKAQELVAELENKGEISSEEGKKLARELLDKAKGQKEEIHRVIRQEIEKLTGKFKFVSREEFDKLKSRLECLEGGSCHCDSQDTL